MASRKSRWPKRSIRHAFPLRNERQARPRFDGDYVASNGQRIRFSDDGHVEVNGATGTWKIDRGTLWLSTAQLQYEGALDPDAAYLLGSVAGKRAELELRFEPDPAD
jgi:hypothetical protein